MYLITTWLGPVSWANSKFSYNILDILKNIVIFLHKKMLLASLKRNFFLLNGKYHYEMNVWGYKLLHKLFDLYVWLHGKKILTTCNQMTIATETVLPGSKQDNSDRYKLEKSDERSKRGGQEWRDRKTKARWTWR